MLQLQQRQRWTTRQRNLSHGDVVLLVTSSEQLCHWPLGIVTSVKLSADGLVRSATVKSGDTHYERPVSKLILLVPAGDESPNSGNSVEPTSVQGGKC